MWVWKQILACLKSPGIWIVAWKTEDGWSVQKVLDLLQPWCSCYLSPSGQEVTRKLLLWSDKQSRLVKYINWFSSIKQFWTHSDLSETKSDVCMFCVPHCTECDAKNLNLIFSLRCYWRREVVWNKNLGTEILVLRVKIDLLPLNQDLTICRPLAASSSISILLYLGLFYLHLFNMA